MDPERREALKKEAETRTDEDNQLLHVIYIHVTEAYTQMLIAAAECDEIEGDERAENIALVLRDTMELIASLSEAAISTVPGVMTPEEVEEELKRIDATADWAIKPTAATTDVAKMIIENSDPDEDEDEGEQTSSEF